MWTILKAGPFLQHPHRKTAISRERRKNKRLDFWNKRRTTERPEFASDIKRCGCRINAPVHDRPWLLLLFVFVTVITAIAVVLVVIFSVVHQLDSFFAQLVWPLLLLCHLDRYALRIIIPLLVSSDKAWGMLVCSPVPVDKTSEDPTRQVADRDFFFSLLFRYRMYF